MKPFDCCNPALSLTVMDLSAKHIGKKVRITEGENAYAGILKDIEFDTWTETNYHGDSVYINKITVSFSNDARLAYPLNATVEVL